MVNQYVVIDLETTGLSPERDKIIEIGAVKIENGILTGTYSKLVNPNVEIRDRIVEITGITSDMIKKCPFIGEVLQEFMQFVGDSIIIGHSIKFDISFLVNALYKEGLGEYVKGYETIDTLNIARKCIPEGVSKRLADLCVMYGIEDKEHHRALNDAFVTHKLYEKLCELYENEGEGIIFKPEMLVCKPYKDKEAPKGQIKFLKELLRYHNLTSEYDIDKMSQREVSRYVDKIILNYGRMKKI